MADGAAPAWTEPGAWLLVGDRLVAAEELASDPPSVRRRRWPGLVGVVVVAVALLVGSRLGEGPGGPLVQVLPSGDTRAVAPGITRAPAERWRSDALAGRQLTAVEQIGDRLVFVTPSQRSRQGQDVFVLRASDGAQVWTGGVVNWSVQQPAIASTTMVVVDRTSRRVRAVDLASGSERWSADGPGQFVLVPAGRSDVVLVGATGGLIVRSLVTGAELWRPPAGLGGAVLSEVLVLVDRSSVTAYDWQSGTVRWSVDLGAAPSWLDGANGIVLARVGQELIGLGVDGAERWRRPWEGVPAAGDVVMPFGAGAVLTSGSSVAAFDLASGSTVLSGVSGALETVLARDDRPRLFVRRSDGVAELDPRSGADRRSVPARDGVLGVSDTILYGVSDSELRGFELTSLQPLWRIRLDEPATLVTAGSVLVLRTTDGVLRALA